MVEFNKNQKLESGDKTSQASEMFCQWSETSSLIYQPNGEPRQLSPGGAKSNSLPKLEIDNANQVNVCFNDNGQAAKFQTSNGLERAVEYRASGGVMRVKDSGNKDSSEPESWIGAAGQVFTKREQDKNHVQTGLKGLSVEKDGTVSAHFEDEKEKHKISWKLNGERILESSSSELKQESALHKNGSAAHRTTYKDGSSIEVLGTSFSKGFEAQELLITSAGGTLHMSPQEKGGVRVEATNPSGDKSTEILKDTNMKELSGYYLSMKELSLEWLKTDKDGVHWEMIKSDNTVNDWARRQGRKFLDLVKP